MNVTKYFMLIIFVVPIIALANAELPDPTRPATYFVDDAEPILYEEIDTKDKVNWKLSAIRISEDDRTAILNGKLIRAGDAVGPGKVIKINPLSIVIDHEDQKLIVRLFNTEVIKNYKLRK